MNGDPDRCPGPHPRCVYKPRVAECGVRKPKRTPRSEPPCRKHTAPGLEVGERLAPAKSPAECALWRPAQCGDSPLQGPPWDAVKCACCPSPFLCSCSGPHWGQRAAGISGLVCARGCDAAWNNSCWGGGRCVARRQGDSPKRDDLHGFQSPDACPIILLDSLTKHKF